MKTSIKLIDYPNRVLVHGTILRLPGQWPYEALVDFMVFDMPGGDRPNGLIVTTGQKAGLVLVLLPQDSSLTDVRGLSTEWIISNWEKWVYPECNVHDVHIIEKYSVVAV